MSASAGLPFVWGATAAECAMTYPCDTLVPQPQHRFVRAIDVAAPAPTMYRWLQQLRIAPYSYDWADNFLLPSPARLTPRADVIAVGQRMMHVFSIVAFEPGRTLTLGPCSRLGTALFGTLYGSYVVTPRGPDACRLLVTVNAVYPRSPYGRLVGGVMPWIDFLMMRRQLVRLKFYAERTARARLAHEIAVHGTNDVTGAPARSLDPTCRADPAAKDVRRYGRSATRRARVNRNPADA